MKGCKEQTTKGQKDGPSKWGEIRHGNPIWRTDRKTTEREYIRIEQTTGKRRKEMGEEDNKT